jgi:peptidoglycan/LPS O-acetylase OafA/YrhL
LLQRAREAVLTDFRTDINGLRAWAVLAVMFYHFGVPGLGGGFVGVDVFFVISGFLMTGIVTRALARGDFSLFGFYLARVRRIVPALMVLCAILLVLGCLVLMPPDYQSLATQAVYSLSFLSNIAFYRGAGYFDSASHEKWLLHTWSLSVEWQFYLLLPVLLWLSWKIRASRVVLAWVLGTAGIASFAAALAIARSDPEAAFFLLHTRAWEMLAGALVVLVRQPMRGGAWLERGGLALIALAIVSFDKHSAWPGWGALLPVLGTVMVLLARGSSPLTANAAAQWLGLRSYSLYLWHWPVCVALAYVELHTSPLALAGGLLLTLGLGHVSYVLVERSALLQRPLWLAPLAACLVLVPGVLIWKLQGVGGRFSPAVEMIAAEAANVNPRRAACHASRGAVSPSCVIGGTERSVILAGDSHASMLATALAAAGGGGQGVLQWSYSGCLYMPGMHLTPQFKADSGQHYQCTEFNAWVRSELDRVPSTVPLVIVGRYALAARGPNEFGDAPEVPKVYFSAPTPVTTPAYLQEFSAQIVATACDAARVRPVYLLRPIPEMVVNVPKVMSRRQHLGRDSAVSISMDQYLARNAWVLAAQDQARARCAVRILDPLPILCRDGRCHGSLHGRPLYSDDNHLSEFGNKLLTPMFGEVFRGR